MRTGIFFVRMHILLLLHPVSAFPGIFPFRRPVELVSVVFGEIRDFVTNADDAVAASLKYFNRRCSCRGAPPYQVCGCCITIARNAVFGEPFCIDFEFSGTSIVSRLIEDGDDVATWEDVVGDLAEGVSLCVEILPRPSPKVSKGRCSESGLGTLSVCVVPEVVDLSFDGGVGYYELCVTLGIGLLGIVDFAPKIGCFSFGAKSEDWECIYPNTTNPDQLPICHDACPDSATDWVQQCSAGTVDDENLLLSHHCGAVKTDDGLCVKGCFDDVQMIESEDSPSGNPTRNHLTDTALLISLLGQMLLFHSGASFDALNSCI